MLTRILGIVWILLGILWLIKPDMLRNRLKKKMSRKVRRIVCGIIMMFGFLLVGSVIKVAGILPKVIGLVGVIIIIKAALLATSKTLEKAMDWWAEKPLIFFRIWAAGILVTGLLLFLV